MIKLKRLLLEGRSVQIDENEVIRILSTNNPSNDFSLMYRGLGQSIDPYLKISPENFERISAYTENYYTTLFDNLPSWKEYPKRGKSIICSNLMNRARNYGNIYYVIPREGCKIAVCPADDIWNSFRNTYKQGLYHFIKALIGCMSLYNMHNNEINDMETFDDIKKVLEYIEYINYNTTDSPKNFENYSHYNYLISIWNSYRNGKKLDLLQFFDEYLLNPNVNKFKLYTYPFDSDEMEYNRELWTDEDSILIHVKSISNIFDKIGGNVI